MRIAPSPQNRSDLARSGETGQVRIRPLSVLPVFLPLDGKPAVVVGGSSAAAWKAELLAAAGARVSVFAAECCEELAGLRAREARILVVERDWSANDFAGAAIVVADAAGPREAEAIRLVTRLVGVPLNVIDKPAYCDFQFGSIVNRSPAVVGISTHGTAPILAQAMRRRIETALPPWLGDWASLAGRIRDRVSGLLPPGAARRVLWERLVDRAFRAAPGPGAETQLFRAAAAIGADRSTGRGRVTLVGAGPGDPELLTVKAMRVLQEADVILYDALVSADILQLGRREARRIPVGKRGGRASCRQEDINAAMVAFARDGKHVVRLKSGDPMIFGRAGEEIETLAAEGIRVDVVPGVTAALAMAAILRVSLTHRDCARSVRFVTAHVRNGGLPDDIDWSAVADPQSTTIFYMGGRMAGLLAATLIGRGLPAQTPAAAGSAVSQPQQAVWSGRLADLAAGVDGLGLDDPVVIGVGAVFARGPSGRGTPGEFGRPPVLQAPDAPWEAARANAG